MKPSFVKHRPRPLHHLDAVLADFRAVEECGSLLLFGEQGVDLGLDTLHAPGLLLGAFDERDLLPEFLMLLAPFDKHAASSRRQLDLDLRGGRQLRGHTEFRHGPPSVRIRR
jgi:hypothetical protein